jgi:hypothetical protein
MHHGHGHLHLLWVFWIPLSFVAMEQWLAAQSWKCLWIFVAIVVLQALSSWYEVRGRADLRRGRRLRIEDR